MAEGKIVELSSTIIPLSLQVRNIDSPSVARGLQYFSTQETLCIIDTGNCVPGKRENKDGSHTRGRNLIIYSCLYLYYVVKKLYANL